MFIHTYSLWDWHRLIRIQNFIFKLHFWGNTYTISRSSLKHDGPLRAFSNTGLGSNLGRNTSSIKLTKYGGKKKYFSNRVMTPGNLSFVGFVDLETGEASQFAGNGIVLAAVVFRSFPFRNRNRSRIGIGSRRRKFFLLPFFFKINCRSDLSRLTIEEL